MIYELQAISINIPAGPFKRDWQADSSGNAKTTSKKTKFGGTTLPGSSVQHKVAVIKMV